jgi:Fe-S cluster biogenesis protein NfuA
MSTSSSNILARVEIAIESIRPYLMADGGDLRIHRIEGEILEIELLGACSSCSISPMTLKAGVEEAVTKSVPEIKRVVAINLTEVSE